MNIRTIVESDLDNIFALLANQSIKKFVDPQDIAELILFLAGPHGRSISGQSIPIDGDSRQTHDRWTQRR